MLPPIKSAAAFRRGWWVSAMAVILQSGWERKERAWIRPMRPNPMRPTLMRLLAPKTRELERAVVRVRAAEVLRKFLREKFLNRAGVVVFMKSLDGSRGSLLRFENLKNGGAFLVDVFMPRMHGGPST